MLFLIAVSLCFKHVLGELPHSTCQYHSSAMLFCEKANLQLPSMFSADLLPVGVEYIKLTCPDFYSRNYCNTMESNTLLPLPYRPRLNRIDLEGFRTVDGSRIPVGKFLANVKQNIAVLIISYSKIDYVDRDFLTGFRSLITLDLSNNDITSVRHDAFQTLSYPMPTGPVLKRLDLSGNSLQQFDWNSIEPLASTLEQLNLQNQSPKLRALQQSGKPFRTWLSRLSLWNNGLEFVPAWILTNNTFPDAATGVDISVHNNAFCVSSGRSECACCEVAEFMHWMKSVGSTVSVPVDIRFSCGSASTEYRNDAYGLALAERFGHCFSTTQAPATLPHTRPPATTTNVPTIKTTSTPCTEPKPIEINCTAGSMKLSQSDLQRAEGTTAVFTSDGTFPCVSKLYDLHTMALELSNIPAQTNTTEKYETIDVHCQHGQAAVNALNPDSCGANKLVFRTDLAVGCYSRFTQFLSYIDENLIGDQDRNVQNLAATPEFSLTSWINSKVCSRRPMVSVNCTAGIFGYSHGNDTAISTSGVAVRSDHSFDCRDTFRTIHEYLLADKRTVVQPVTSPELDTIVAVCQKGRLFISDGNARRSTKLKLQYFSSPNRSCRSAFHEFLQFVLRL
ncbi:uncharacterized protein LOC129594926 [Paramacrobiotus metropolitanus]|uniref:uncharacterized protein LOC129594926 n=1 Tax=Paramacrobiotus metropolitanus TaxID=2943436 RepID=UPI0024459471|nr:uncharacterized protein LOC129594926 [Paramacrobiotus metropolitanus]